MQRVLSCRSWYERSRQFLTMVAAMAIVVAGVVLPGVEVPTARAATSTSCSYANAGSGTFASTLCWFDFSGYDPAQATSADGQEMAVTLPDGSKMSFTLKASGGGIRANAFPTYSAAYLGNGAYTGVRGRPALYQSGSATTTDLRLTDVRVTNPYGQQVTAFSLVGADAESTDTNESIRWRSSDPIYSLTRNGSDPGIGNACNKEYSGLGTTEVVCAADRSSNKTGTPIVASENPSSFTQRMVGGGRQAVAFGVLVSEVELTKEVESRFGGDDFAVYIDGEDDTWKFDASTGPTGTTATTGRQKVIAKGHDSTFRFYEEITNGRAGNYDASWECTRNGRSDPTLPSGRSPGRAADVSVGIGDFVHCTITNSKKPAGLSLEKDAGTPEDVNGNGLTDVGDRIAYTFVVTNTGEVAVDPPTIDDPKIGAVTCPEGELAPGASVTCTADAAYPVSAEDQRAGAVENTATASATVAGTDESVTSNESTTSTPLTDPDPSLSLAKSATPYDSESFQVGQEITYTFVVTNTGNVPVEDVTVEEESFSGSGELSELDCPDQRRLAPDETMTCTATYTLTQDDVDAGELTNSATATGSPPGEEPLTTPPADVTIPGDPAPAVSLEKSVDPDTAGAPGDEIVYTFHVTNTGNVTLRQPVIEETSFTGSGPAPEVSCPDRAFGPGESVDCTATYTLTQADVDTGRVDNAASASATAPSGETSRSEESEATVRIPPETGLELAKSAAPERVAEVGQTVEYSFVVTNTGNVSIEDISVDEGEFTGSGELGELSCPRTSLGGGESMTCTASYAVTQADLDSGGIENTATATGTPPGDADPITTPPSKARVPADQEPALSLEKTAEPREATIGQEVVYRFTVTNTGNVSVSNPSIEETRFTGSGELSDAYCPTVVLAPGESTECTATYTLTAEDESVDTLENTAVATAQPPVGADQPTSNESTATVEVLVPGVSLTKTADTNELVVGATITYSFTVTNTGDTSLTDIEVSEGEFTGSGEMSEVSALRR